MGLAIEVLHSIIVKDAKGKPRIRIDFLRILLHVGLLLYSLELPKQKHRGISNGMLLALLLQRLCLLLDDVREDGVVDGQAIDGIELLDQLETHGASHPAVPDCIQAYM